jgi:hypothetical protein
MRRRFTLNKGFTKTFDFNNYLTIEALEDNLTLVFTNDIEYGIDGKGWIKLKAGYKTQSINTGQTLSFRGKLIPNSSNGIGTFTINKKCNLKGNCMSMLFGDNAADNYSLSGKVYVFYRLFDNCSNIVTVNENFLPATTLSSACYHFMFYKCTSLTTAPKLPATTLADYCYDSMFDGCTSLVNAPALPATTLANSCYQSMFDGCTSLTTATELPAITLADRCYGDMFRDCTSLTAAPELSATTLAARCYQYMFIGCTSLTSAPALPATTLSSYCYESMFRNCVSLVNAPTILPAMTLKDYCYDSMFQNCISLITAPTLPATKLADYCYGSMFKGCTKLNYIKMLATDITAKSCLYHWVYGVSSTGTFVKNPAMTSLPTAESFNYYVGIPIKWTVLNA